MNGQNAPSFDGLWATRSTTGIGGRPAFGHRTPEASSGADCNVEGATIASHIPGGQDTMMKNEKEINVNTKHQCMTAMKEVEDYGANRKSADSDTAKAFGFGGGLGASIHPNPTVFGGLSGDSSAATTPFSQNLLLFTKGSGFGATRTPTQWGFRFGATTATTTQSGLTFGATTATTTQSGLTFGATTATTTQSGLILGATTATTTQSGLVLGATTATTTQSGLVLGATTATTTQSGLTSGATTAATTQSGLVLGATTATTTQSGLVLGATTATTTQSGLTSGATTAATTRNVFRFGATTATATQSGLTSGATTATTTRRVFKSGATRAMTAQSGSRFGYTIGTQSSPPFFATSARCDDKEFCVVLDLRPFKREEVEVKPCNRLVIINAKHEEKHENYGFVMGEMKKVYKLPEHVDPKSVTWTINVQSLLSIKAVKHAKETPTPVKLLITPLREKLKDPDLLLDGWSTNYNDFPAFEFKDLYNYLCLSNHRAFDSSEIQAAKELKPNKFYSEDQVLNMRYHAISDECSHAFIAAEVLPENMMCWVSLSKVTNRVNSAYCNCEASQRGSCNHVAALLFSLMNITDRREVKSEAVT